MAIYFFIITNIIFTITTIITIKYIIITIIIYD